MTAFGICALASLLAAGDASPERPQVAPLAQDYTVVYHNRDRGFYVEGCGLARLDDGGLVVAQRQVEPAPEAS